MSKIIALVMLAVSTGAYAQKAKKESLLPVEPKQVCNLKRVDIPDPFSPYNKYAELSPGELYSLHGKIAKAGNQFFLQVNLNMHPWLAGKIRTENPFYMIEGNGMNLAPYLGKMVQLNFIAQKREVVMSGKSFITIRLLEVPTLITVCFAAEKL